jgi:hypothetical protein
VIWKRNKWFYEDPSQEEAVLIQGTGRSDTAGPQGKGFGDESDPMYTLDSVSGHGVATQSNVRR